MLAVTQQKLVLVIEDNQDHQKLLKAQLQDMRLNSILAITGCEGLQLAQVHQPNVILLDIVLPDISGFTIIEQLKQDAITANIPIIAVTAQGFIEQRDAIIEAGADAYIAKPYRLEDLELAIIQSLIYRKP